MPQLDPTWFASQLFWLAVTFIVLYVLLSKLVLPPLQDILARREQTVSSDIEQAQQLKTEAETARADYERALAESRSRAQQVMSDAMQAHKAQAEQASRDMDRQIEAKLTQASQAIESKKQELLTALAPATAELTAMIVEKLTRRSPSPDKVRAAIGGLSKSHRNG